MVETKRKKRYSRQQIQKLFHGECFVCHEDQYELLDAHRIIEQGVYKPHNIVVLCCKCHRRVHNKEIRFDRKYLSTGGLLLHWWNGNVELWTKVKN